MKQVEIDVWRGCCRDRGFILQFSKDDPLRVLLALGSTYEREYLSKLLSFEHDLQVIASLGSVEEVLQYGEQHAPDVVVWHLEQPDNTQLYLMGDFTRQVNTRLVLAGSPILSSSFDFLLSAYRRGVIGAAESPFRTAEAIRRAACTPMRDGNIIDGVWREVNKDFRGRSR